MKNYKPLHGILTRPEMRCDSAMVRECQKNYKDFTFDEKSKILDLGGNIGSFGYIALKNGARPENYTAFEPDQENLKLLRLNTHENANLIAGVVTMEKDPTLTFYQTKSSNSACSGTATIGSSLARSQRKVLWTTTNYYFPEVLEKYKPTHLKVDIEGGEDAWLRECRGVMPKYVEQFAIELHWKSTIQFFEDECINNILKDFDLVRVKENVGFVNQSKDKWNYPKIGVSCHGVLYGIDLFFRRKK